MPDELTVENTGDDDQNAVQPGDNALGTPPTEDVVPLEKSPEEYQKEITGLLETAKSERGKRQVVEGRVNELTNQLAYIAQMQQQNQAAAPAEVDEFDDDYISKKDFRKETEKVSGQITEGFNAILVMSEKIARMKYDDYDDVIKYYTARQQANPVLKQQVLGSSDPAEEAYQIGRQHPDYYETAIKKQTQQNADRMNRNSLQPSTLTDTGAASTAAASDLKKINDMSLEDINNILEGNARGIKKR